MDYSTAAVLSSHHILATSNAPIQLSSSRFRTERAQWSSGEIKASRNVTSGHYVVAVEVLKKHAHHISTKIYEVQRLGQQTLTFMCLFDNYSACPESRATRSFWCTLTTDRAHQFGTNWKRWRVGQGKARCHSRSVHFYYVFFALYHRRVLSFYCLFDALSICWNVE